MPGTVPAEGEVPDVFLLPGRDVAGGETVALPRTRVQADHPTGQHEPVVRIPRDEIAQYGRQAVVAPDLVQTVEQHQAVTAAQVLLEESLPTRGERTRCPRLDGSQHKADEVEVAVAL